VGAAMGAPEILNNCHWAKVLPMFIGFKKEKSWEIKMNPYQPMNFGGSKIVRLLE